MNEVPAYRVVTLAPGRLSLRDLATCTAVVKRGDAVDPDSAQSELPRAEILAMALIDEKIVGVGAVKRKRPAYAKRVADSSKFSFNQDSQELGYVAVDNGHRGHRLSSRIVTALLLQHDGPLFATTSNEYMKNTLANAGFVHKGLPWEGRKGQELSLWIRDPHSSSSKIEP